MQKKLLDLFAETELVPAQGCTEPGAVAFAVASAAKYSEGNLKRILLRMDGFVYKNGMTTGLPGIEDHFGNKVAAALGYFADNPLQKKLTVLADLEDKLDDALDIMDKVEFEILEEEKPVYVEAVVEADNTVRALINGKHDDLQYIKTETEIFYQNDDNNEEEKKASIVDQKLKKMNVNDMIDMIEKEFSQKHFQLLEDGFKLNSRIAEAGRKGTGCGIGNSYRSSKFFNEVNEIAAKAANGTGARMAGAASPALASSGSGNQGIFISLVTYHAAKLFFEDISDEKIYKATMLAHLIGHYAKIYVGRLSALCGLFYAAAPGVLAALLYLADKSDKIETGINNLISDTSGVYCDGAKGSCAFKAASAAELAVRHFELMVDGLDCYLPSGFISCSLDKTFENLAAISHPDEHTVNTTLFKVVENNFEEI
ncbi:MAG: L-serine ammonia-lyase, iron-sulfur-dependent, subunit alpha [Bacillota bacterium]